MKCDRVPASLAAGGIFDRWRATRHLRICPRCEAEAAGLLEILRILADAPPLNRAQRASWVASSLEPRASKLTFAIPRRLAAGLAMGLLIATIAYRLTRDGRMVPELAPEAPSQVLRPIDPPSERERLALDMLARVDRLESELADLRRHADLLDARREADVLWSRYARFDSTAL